MTAIWVVAVEYTGADLAPYRPARRRAVLEHAFDVDTGRIAHGDGQVRVGFPRPARGWPVASHVVRCPGCSRVVTASLAAVVAAVVGRRLGTLVP